MTAADCSLGTISVTQTSFHEFVIDDDTAPLLGNAYVSYRVATGAGDSFDDLWVRLESFSDTTKLDLATEEDGLYHVGPVANSSAADSYFYLVGAATNTAQSYTVNLFEGNPNYGGSSVCFETGSHDKVTDEIQAAANKVTSVVSTAPYIGGTMTITVKGDTGTMSSSRPEGSVFSFTPASISTWPADCYELFDTQVTFTGGNTGTYNDGLVITGLNSATSSYTIVYSFKATCTTLAPTTVTPVNYISSGGSNLKHTDTGTTTYTAIPPLPPAENRVTMTKSVSPGGSVGGGTVGYTLTFSNTAPIPVTIDLIQDTLPASPAVTSYVASSSEFNGVAATEPNISGQVLTWGGTFTIPANSSRNFTYDATIPATNGIYTNSAIAFVGATQIDQTITTLDNSPATASHGVGDPNLAGSTKSSLDINGGNLEPGDTIRYTISVINNGSLSASGVDVTDTIDSDTENVSNVVVGANATNCGVSYSNASTASQLIINNITILSAGTCDITFEASVKAGTADNTDVLNTATIGQADEGGVGGIATSTPLSVQLTPNLVVTKTENDADNYVTAGQVIAYTIIIDNDGDTNATGVDVTDTVAGTATSVVSAITATNCGSLYTDNSSGQIIDIANVDVATATNCVITYNVTVDAGATSSQTITNAVDVGVANQGGNNPAVVNATTLTVGSPPTPSLSVSKTENDVDNSVTPGQTVSYTVTITNATPATTGTTSFTDAIDTDFGSPSNFSYTDCGGSESANFSAPTLTVSGLAVTNAASCVVTYDLVVDSPLNEGTTLTNSADVAQASQGGNNPAAVAATTLTVDATPNLSASTKTEDDTDNYVAPGQTVAYTISIVNSGNGQATGVEVSDTVDANGAIQTGTINLTDCGSFTDNSTPSLIDITTISVAPGVDCVITFDYLINSPLNEGVTIANSATISAPLEGGVGATPSASLLTIDATPALTVSKAEDDGDDTVTPGQLVTYTVTIENSGDGDATTSLTDVIDTNVSAPQNILYQDCGSPIDAFIVPTLTVSSITIVSGATCSIAYDVIVQTIGVEGAVITNDVDVAQSTEGGNDPAIASAATLTYDANDGVDAIVESTSPNSGDANEDGLQDDEQPDVTSFVNPVTNTYAVLENANSCINKNVLQTTPSTFGASDGELIYPVGLMNFELLCGTVGMTATVSQYFFGDYDASLLVARKYSYLTNTYTTIPNAIIENIVINGEKVIKITYDITDGGPLDDDGIANGTIIDPSGPALTIVDAAVTAPNTGIKAQNIWESLTFILCGITAIFVSTRFHRLRKFLD